MSARSYLDHAATSPVRPEVAEQVARDLADGLAGRANPAATHASGRRAGALLAQARARLAAALGVDAHEILLTSGGTEADGLVVVGRALAAVRAGMDRPRIVISAVEHPAVADSARLAERLGARVEVVGVDRAGLVDPGKVAGAVEAGGTALVSVMAANNETGAVQDVPGIVTAVRQVTGAARPASPLWVPVHCDAVAALGRVPVDPGR